MTKDDHSADAHASPDVRRMPTSELVFVMMRPATGDPPLDRLRMDAQAELDRHIPPPRFVMGSYVYGAKEAQDEVGSSVVKKPSSARESTLLAELRRDHRYMFTELRHEADRYTMMTDRSGGKFLPCLSG
jgi:hypothetical protein